jgi:tRNA U38,U39,U40 pseudouridine synthase TruA
MDSQQQIIDTHPAFRLRCTCQRRTYRFEITKPGSEPYRDSFCMVCSAQIEALGFRTRLLGR